MLTASHLKSWASYLVDFLECLGKLPTYAQDRLEIFGD